MKYLILLSVIISGCSQPGMTNEEIVAQVKICRDAGMGYTVMSNMMGHPVRVVCHEVNE